MATLRFDRAMCVLCRTGPNIRELAEKSLLRPWLQPVMCMQQGGAVYTSVKKSQC